MINIKNPEVIDKLLNDESFNKLKSLFKNPKSFYFQPTFSRWVIADNSMPELNEYANSVVPIARDIFNSKELIPTYTLFSHYEGKNASLYKHKDDNACTYTIDLCLYQKTPWDLWVDGKPYTLNPNQALAYYGNDQLHWRESFPDPDDNHVAMIFFHFAEPDHWYFKEGPEYIDVIRKNNISSKRN